MLFFLGQFIQFLLLFDFLFFGLASQLLVSDYLIGGVDDGRLFVALGPHALLHDAPKLQRSYFFLRKSYFLRFIMISWFAINKYIYINSPKATPLITPTTHPTSEQLFSFFAVIYFYKASVS
jgi:hypothetical protein